MTVTEMELSKEERRRLRKEKKRALQEAAAEEACDEVEEPASPDAASPSKKKKKKKEKKEEKEGSTTPEPEEASPAPSKKDKKKKKKEKEEEAAAQEPEEPEKKKKKEKKRDREADDVEQAASPKGEKKKKGGLSPEETEKWRDENKVTVNNVAKGFAPLTTFEGSGIPSDILACTASFDKPSVIQAQAWPLVMAGHDVVGIAKTGSGKTLAFMLPAFVRIRESRGKASWKPQALVLAPTRELCTQIAKVGVEAGKPCKVKVACVYGGMPKDVQRKELSDGSNIVVATPGRLKDFISEESVSLSDVCYAVLDEADRMLDMGFEDDVRMILGQASKSRQTLMFSATWPESIQQLAKEFLKNPAQVTIGSLGLAANHAITQKVEVIGQDEKFKRLLQLLKEYHKSKTNRVLVFALYKKEAARLETQLWNAGFNVLAIHGDMTQQQRNSAFEKFKSGEVPLIVATDVAARGLDIKGVEYVINYSFPLTVDDYIHRIGRTGRAGRTGFSHTFFTTQDRTLGPDLIKVLQEAKQEVPKDLEKFRNVMSKKPAARTGESKDGGFKIDVSSAPANRITFDSDSD